MKNISCQLLLFYSLVVWNNPFGVDVLLTEKPDLYKQKLKTVSERNLRKYAGPFIKTFFFCRCLCHILLQEIIWLVSPPVCQQVWRIFLTYIEFLNVNIYVSINDYLFKYIYLVCYVKFCFYYLTCSADFITPNNHQRF